MRKYLFLLALFTITACEEQAASQNDKFPGFIAVENTDYLYEKASIAASGETDRHFKLVKALKDGYILQDAVTDCKETITTQNGSFYSDSAATPEEYSGSISTGKRFNIKNEPELSRLMGLVCAVRFDIADKPALDIAAITENYASHEKKNARDVAVQTIFEQEIQANKRDYKVYMTYANHHGNDCHACIGKLGVFVWQKQDDGQWAQIQNVYDFSNQSKGGFGTPPDVKLMQMEENTVFALYGSYMAQGYVTESVDLYLLAGNGLEAATNPPGAIAECNTNIEGQDDCQFDLSITDDDTMTLLVGGYDNTTTIETRYPITIKNGRLVYENPQTTAGKAAHPHNTNDNANHSAATTAGTAIAITPQNKQTGFLIADTAAKTAADTGAPTAQLPNGAQVQVTGRSQDQTWREVQYNGKTYYIPAGNVAIFTD